MPSKIILLFLLRFSPFIAGGSGSLSVAVKASDYLSSLKDQALLSVTVLAVVSETSQSWVSKIPCRLHRPDLTLKLDKKEGNTSTSECHSNWIYPCISLSVLNFIPNPQ